MCVFVTDAYSDAVEAEKISRSGEAGGNEEFKFLIHHTVLQR